MIEFIHESYNQQPICTFFLMLVSANICIASQLSTGEKLLSILKESCNKVQTRISLPEESSSQDISNILLYNNIREELLRRQKHLEEMNERTNSRNKIAPGSSSEDDLSYLQRLGKGENNDFNAWRNLGIVMMACSESFRGARLMTTWMVFAEDLIKVLREGNFFSEWPFERGGSFQRAVEQLRRNPSSNNQGVLAFLRKSQWGDYTVHDREELIRLIKENNLFDTSLLQPIIDVLCKWFWLYCERLLDSETYRLLEKYNVFSTLPLAEKIHALIEASSTTQDPFLEDISLFLLECSIRLDDKVQRLGQQLVNVPNNITVQGCSGRNLLMLILSIFGKNTLRRNPELESASVLLLGLFVERGMAWDVKDRSGVTPLHVIAATWNVQAGELLLRYQKEINCIDAAGDAPLHVAISSWLPFQKTLERVRRNNKEHTQDPGSERQRQMCAILLAHNADIDVKDKQGNTPLHRAVIHNNVPIAKLLLSRKANANSKNRFDQTPLHLACIKNNLLIKRLIKNGALSTEKDCFGNQPIHYAAVSGVDLFDITDEGNNLTCSNEAGWSPLHIACFFKNYSLVTGLLRRNIGVNAQIRGSGKTGFMIVCAIGDTVLCDQFLAHPDLNVDIQDKLVGTALDWACEFEHVDICKMLLESNRYNNQSPENKVRVLRRTCYYNNQALQNLFFDAWQGSWDQVDDRGNTVLNIARSKGYHDVINLLYQRVGSQLLGATHE